MKKFYEFCIYPLKKALWAPASVFLFYVAVLYSPVISSSYLPLWWDSVVHFAGGIAICFFFSAATKGPHARIFLGQHTRFSLFVLLVSLTALAAVLWEITEWIDKQLTGRAIQTDVTDTISDMAMGLIGGAVMAMKVTLKK
ncbi:MAG: hypothetical protein ACLFRA_08945 [Alphaproteobacteria bacterium]